MRLARLIFRVILAVLMPRRAAAKYALEYDALEQLEYQLKQRSGELRDTRQQLELAQAKIETQEVSLEGMAVVVEQYRAELEALARIHAMKGRTPNHEADQ